MKVDLPLASSSIQFPQLLLVCERERERRRILRRCTHTNFTYGKEFYVFPPPFLSPLMCCDMWVRMPQPRNEDDDDDMLGGNNNKLALALLLLLFSVAWRGKNAFEQLPHPRFPHSSHFFSSFVPLRFMI